MKAWRAPDERRAQRRAKARPEGAGEALVPARNEYVGQSEPHVAEPRFDVLCAAASAAAAPAGLDGRAGHTRPARRSTSTCRKSWPGRKCPPIIQKKIVGSQGVLGDRHVSARILQCFVGISQQHRAALRGDPGAQRRRTQPATGKGDRGRRRRGATYTPQYRGRGSCACAAAARSLGPKDGSAARTAAAKPACGKRGDSAAGPAMPGPGRMTFQTRSTTAAVVSVLGAVGDRAGCAWVWARAGHCGRKWLVASRPPTVRLKEGRAGPPGPLPTEARPAPRPHIFSFF